MKNAPNKARTGRWGFCRIFGHSSGFEFFLLPRVPAALRLRAASGWHYQNKEERAL
jgi:hypothetical protein